MLVIPVVGGGAQSAAMENCARPRSSCGTRASVIASLSGAGCGPTENDYRSFAAKVVALAGFGLSLKQENPAIGQVERGLGSDRSRRGPDEKRKPFKARRCRAPDGDDISPRRVADWLVEGAIPGRSPPARVTWGAGGTTERAARWRGRRVFRGCDGIRFCDPG